jgi:hypothetical protein
MMRQKLRRLLTVVYGLGLVLGWARAGEAKTASLQDTSMSDLFRERGGARPRIPCPKGHSLDSMFRSLGSNGTC